jgi:hypothetical protein
MQSLGLRAGPDFSKNPIREANNRHLDNFVFDLPLFSKDQFMKFSLDLCNE